MGAHKTASEDKCDSSWAYLSSSFITSLFQNLKKLKNLHRTRPPGAIIDYLEQRYGPNTSDRSFGTPLGAHKTATEDKCVSTWAYLSSYLYYHPLLESKQISQICRERPPGAKTLPLSAVMGQIPATEALGRRWVPIRRPRKTSVIVLGHTYRVIYISSAPHRILQISKSAENDPRDPQ